MPERGWYSLTVREETARRVREQARARGLTVDELINELLTAVSKDVWLICSLCGARIKAGNMPKHMARSTPESSWKMKTTKNKFDRSIIHNLSYTLARIIIEMT